MGRIDAYPAGAESTWAQARGYLAGELGAMALASAQALSKAAAESARFSTPAVATYAGRRYKITALIATTSGGAWLYTVLRIRRGTTTAGTLLANTLYPRPPTSGWITMRVEAFDTPGDQAAQQWCMTHQLDSSVCDLYSPSGVWVEDVGPT